MQGLKLFDINNSDIKKIVSVTDTGANVVAAFKNHVRMSCASHVLNTVLSNTFQETNMNGATAQLELIRTCKPLVQYFKHAGLMKQECETLWNSKLLLLCPMPGQ